MTLALNILMLLVIIVILFAGITIMRARHNEHRAEASHPPEGQFLDMEGHRLHVVVCGQPQGTAPDLVLIHGSSGNTRDYTHRLVDQLTNSYRVIIFDRPGLGYSEAINPKGDSITAQAALFVKAAQTLGAHAPIVLGQSYGGAVALAWAVHHPDSLSALVLLAAPSQPWTTPLDPYYRVTSHPILGPLVIPMITAWVDNRRVTTALAEVFAPQTTPAGYGAHIGAGLTLRRASTRANALQRANLLDEITALHPQYPRLTLPIEMLHGEADTTVGIDIHARPLAKTLPNAHLTPLAGIGHMPQHVAQPDVIAAIQRATHRAGLH